MFCKYEYIVAMTVGIPDFQIKIVVFKVMRASTFVSGYQHFKGTLKLVPSAYSTHKVEAVRFLQNIGGHS